MDSRLFKVLSVTYSPALATAAVGAGSLRRRPSTGAALVRRMARPVDVIAKRPVR